MDEDGLRIGIDYGSPDGDRYGRIPMKISRLTLKDIERRNKWYKRFYRKYISWFCELAEEYGDLIASWIERFRQI